MRAMAPASAGVAALGFTIVLLLVGSGGCAVMSDGARSRACHGGPSILPAATASADSARFGTSQRNSSVAAAAPTSCATMKPGTSTGRIPANVSLAARARVTAGLANDVEAVNQYAAVMYAATANGTAAVRSRAHPQITASRPNVATNSLNICAGPWRVCREAKNS